MVLLLNARILLATNHLDYQPPLSCAVRPPTHDQGPDASYQREIDTETRSGPSK